MGLGFATVMGWSLLFLNITGVHYLTSDGGAESDQQINESMILS